MILNISAPTATVIISGMVLVVGIITKLYLKPSTPANPTHPIIEAFTEGMKSILISQHELLAKQTTTLALMEQKVNGSHEKLSFVTKVVVGTDREVGEMRDKVDEIWRKTTK